MIFGMFTPFIAGSFKFREPEPWYRRRDDDDDDYGSFKRFPIDF